jgi:hypothetical protein
MERPMEGMIPPMPPLGDLPPMGGDSMPAPRKTSGTSRRRPAAKPKRKGKAKAKATKRGAATRGSAKRASKARGKGRAKAKSRRSTGRRKKR